MLPFQAEWKAQLPTGHSVSGKLLAIKLSSAQPLKRQIFEARASIRLRVSVMSIIIRRFCRVGIEIPSSSACGDYLNEG